MPPTSLLLLLLLLLLLPLRRAQALNQATGLGTEVPADASRDSCIRSAPVDGKQAAIGELVKWFGQHAKNKNELLQYSQSQMQGRDVHSTAQTSLFGRVQKRGS